MRSIISFTVIALWSLTACAQDTEIENNVPIEAEATTAIVPGQDTKTESTTTTTTTNGSATTTPDRAQPDRIYTDGALSDPTPEAADLGMASPSNKTVIDLTKDSDDHPR